MQPTLSAGHQSKTFPPPLATNAQLTEVTLNLLQNTHAGLSIDHVDGDATLAEPTSPTDAVQVCVKVRLVLVGDRQIKVHHQGHHRHIDALKQNRLGEVRA